MNWERDGIENKMEKEMVTHPVFLPGNLQTDVDCSLVTQSMGPQR